MELKPTLTEPGVHYFLRETLKKCRNKKYSFYSKFFNIFLLLAFAIALSGFLYYKYKGKLTLEEKKQISLNKEKYIWETIKKSQQKSKKQYNLIITDLPDTNENTKNFK